MLWQGPEEPRDGRESEKSKEKPEPKEEQRLGRHEEDKRQNPS